MEEKIIVPIEPVTKVDFDSLISGLDEQLTISQWDNAISQEKQLEEIELLLNNWDTTWNEKEVSVELIEERREGLVQDEIIESSEEHVFTISEESIADELVKINKDRKHRKITNFVFNQVKFLSHYIIVSVVIFIVLLTTTNYSAYSKIAYNIINPENLKNSSREILNAMNSSKINVFADEESSSLWVEQQEKIKKNLEESNLQLRDTYFSPKKLVPLKSSVDLNVEIMPYENRLVIPKIWKNVPLVDVDSRRGNLDFNNLENLFMKELEKWVLRYPWTAKPGENGNVFMFWHSSNYAWENWNYNDVFALLDNLEFWDEIIIYYNQKRYTYVVNEKKVVKPGNVKILDRDPSKKEVSLMTCRPIGTSINRLIAFAELKEVK